MTLIGAKFGTYGRPSSLLSSFVVLALVFTMAHSVICLVWWMWMNLESSQGYLVPRTPEGMLSKVVKRLPVLPPALLGSIYGFWYLLKIFPSTVLALMLQWDFSGPSGNI